MEARAAARFGEGAVFVNPLANLPANFDEINATAENAARLRAAGVAVSFAQEGDASHNARKIRQLAGNAVANGLPWEDGLAGLTRVPAETFGVADQFDHSDPDHVRTAGCSSSSFFRSSMRAAVSGSVRSACT